jgi:hypothetical protein
MPPLKLSKEELRQLQNIANSRSMPHSIVQRAQIVLACGAGESNTPIAKRMGLTGSDGREVEKALSRVRRSQAFTMNFVPAALVPMRTTR